MRFQQNTVVLAGAGTGKTRKLVETYVGLLEDGADPLRIPTVTFTEKAAGEMRERVRAAIHDRMKNAPDAMLGRWMRILNALPAAPISTIHGFCSSLLRQHGLCAGIDPSFAILDEQESLDLARDAAIETIRDAMHAGDAGTERLFADFGLDGLVDAIVRAAYWVNSLGKDGRWLEERAADQAKQANRLAAQMADELATYPQDFDAIGRLADEADARRVPHPLRERDNPEAVLPRIGQMAGAAAACSLSSLTASAMNRFRAKKRAAGAADFDDLLLGVRDLLKETPSVRNHYQRYFQAVLVDEFQDTDEVQAEIIRLLASDPEDETRLAPGKLLVVGDPKQSIYRFRRARVTVFLRMIDAILAQGGRVERLQENYRAAPPLVEFSNRLSEAMMDGAGKHRLGGAVDTSYRIRFSEADVLRPQSSQPFLGIVYVAADAEARAARGREMDAEAMARLLRTWKASGVIQSWREAAMLMRTMTHVAVYTDALENHAIPFNVVQGTQFYRKPEVSDLVALLECIVRPHDPVARAIASASALGGLSFNEILEGKTPAALNEILAPWIEKRDAATAAEILEDVIGKTHFDVVMMAQKNGEQRVANIGKLIEMTRALSRKGTTGLDDVVRRLRDRILDGAVREGEAQIVHEDEDAVRVMTVHQAKGLEFDVVLIPELAANTRSNGRERLRMSDPWGLLVPAGYGLHRKPLPHALILEAKREDDDQDFEEEKRLLYVAVTRARKLLVLGEAFRRQAGPWLQWVEKLFEQVHPGALKNARAGEPATVRFRSRGQDFSVDVLPASAVRGHSNLGTEANFLRVTDSSGFTATSRAGNWSLSPNCVDMTPSDLTALAGCFRYFHWTRILGMADPGRTPAGDSPQMRLGSAAHKILEYGTIPDGNDLESQGLGDLKLVFESEEWRALQQGPVERELPFIMHIRAAGRDCFIRGRMDAVVPSDPPRVIDYKFAAWKPGADAGYAMQMTAYALALMKSIGVDKAVAELWYLKSPMTILREEHTREESEHRVSAVVERYIIALRTNDWPMADKSYCDSMECSFRAECWDKFAIRNSQSEI